MRSALKTGALLACFALTPWARAADPSAALAASAPPPLKARVRVYQPNCASARPADVEKAVREASALLMNRCGIGLTLTAYTRLSDTASWCELPPNPKVRAGVLADLAQEAKQADPGCLAFFLMPTRIDTRFSWALVEVSKRAGCASPEPRFLDRFGTAFFTDLVWLVGQNEPTDPSQSAILVAHEVLHSLTQRGHPTEAPRGAVMADSPSDMGPDIDPDWCACARQSPYLSPGP